MHSRSILKKNTKLAIFFPAVLFTAALPATALTTTQTPEQDQSLPAPHQQIGGGQCVETDKIAAYKVESDELVRLFLKDNAQMILRLKRHCPQLYFHRYISYTPVDGKICAGSDEIKTRAGLTCRIGSITIIPAAKKSPSKTPKSTQQVPD